MTVESLLAFCWLHDLRLVVSNRVQGLVAEVVLFSVDTIVVFIDEHVFFFFSSYVYNPHLPLPPILPSTQSSSTHQPVHLPTHILISHPPIHSPYPLIQNSHHQPT